VEKNNNGQIFPGNPEILTALAGHFTGGTPAGILPPEVIRELGEELAKNSLIREDLVAFWNLLGDTLGLAGYKVPEGGEIRLLNLACGPCVEAAILSAFFGKPAGPGASSNRVRFFGMDLRGQEIDKAQRRYAATESVFQKFVFPLLKESGGDTAPQVEFFADDATRLVGYREIPQSFDIIFMRHQNVWNDLPVWRKIFQFALERLETDGQLIITSYFDKEHLIAIDLFKKLGAEIITSRRNPDSRPLDYPGKSADRHMAVIRRATE